MPVWLGAFLLIVVASVAVLAFGYRTATLTPIQRETVVTLPNWPVGHPPLRLALLSDIHVAGPDMPPERQERIVDQVNAARPALVLIAGDFTSDKSVASRRYSTAQAVAPLAALRAPLGTWAVPGNHDHWRNLEALHRALPTVGVRLLQNEAARVGPVVLLGLDDDFSGHADVGRTLASANGMVGPHVVLTHGPDPAPSLAGRANLVLARQQPLRSGLAAGRRAAHHDEPIWRALCLRPGGDRRGDDAAPDCRGGPGGEPAPHPPRRTARLVAGDVAG